ncbi:MAG: GNAT family N-acetyltransferase [Promethearchaeota archaeon]
MGLRSIANDDAAIEAYKEQISRYTQQLEALGFRYRLYLNDEEVVGLGILGKEPLQLFKPVGTPLARLVVLDYKQPMNVLKAFADEVLSLAKEREVEYAYLNISAEHKDLIGHLRRIGFEELANRYEMTRPLDESFVVTDLLRYEQLQRKDVNKFFDCMKEFMSGSPDDILNLVMKNFSEVPEAILDAWYEGVQAYFVYHEEELIGILDLVPPNSFIQNIGVSPAHRGKGFGTEMLRFCLNLFKDRGGKEAELGVHVKNKRAIHVYEKLGFSVDRQIQTLVWWKPS